MKELHSLLDELTEGQKKTLLELGQRIVPNLTEDDIWQPNDFSELENNPHFRYEEGVLAGILMTKAAIMANRTLS